MLIFSKKLKQIRTEKNFTQKAVADLLGITPHAYQKYEYGEREPSLENFIKLCEFYEVSADYLLGRTDKREVNK